MLDVQRDGLRDVALERGFAFADPAGDLEQAGGVLACQREHGVHQGVRFHQRAVEIDAERNARTQQRGLPGASKRWISGYREHFRRGHGPSGDGCGANRTPYQLYRPQS